MNRPRYVGYANLDRKIETPDRNPMQAHELQNLISMAAEKGYTVKEASEIKSRYQPVLKLLSELYAAWYALENNITVFADNFSALIKFTGWQRAMLRAA